MTDATIGVGFTAITGPLDAGVAEVKTQLAGLRAYAGELNASFLAFGNQARTGTIVAAGGLRNVAQGAKEAGEAVTHMIGPIQMMRDALSGVGEALIAAFAIREIAEFAKNMAETAVQVAHAAETFGTTTAEIQKLNAEAAFMDVSGTTITTAMGRVSRALVTAQEGSKRSAELFRRMGIDIHSALTPLELLNKTVTALAAIPNPAQRLGIAYQMLGRGAQSAVGPLIDMASHMAEFNAVAAQYGVQNDKAEQSGLALAHSLEVGHVAMKGLGNVLTTALAPALTQIVTGLNSMILQFVQSYQAGGIAKQMLDFLAAALLQLFAAVEIVVDGFVGLAQSFNLAATSLSAAWTFMMTATEASVGVLIDAVNTLGKVIYDVIQGNIVKAANDAVVGWNKLTTDAQKTANTIATAFHAMATSVQASLTQMQATRTTETTALQELFRPHALPPLPKPGPGGLPENLASGGKTKAGKSDLSALEEKLAKQEDDIRAHTGAWLADMQGFEFKFWQQQLDAAKKASDKVAIQKKIDALVLATHRTAAEELLQVDKNAIDAARGSATATAAAWVQYLADVKTLYTEDSVAFRRAQQEKADAARAAAREAYADQIGDEREAADNRIEDLRDAGAREKAATEQKIKDIEDAQKRGQIGMGTANREITPLIGEEQAQANAQAEATFEVRRDLDERIKTDSQSTDAQIQAAKRDEAAAERQLDHERVSAFDAAQAQIEARARETADHLRDIGRSWIGPFVSTFTSGLTQVMEGQESWGKLWRSTLDSMLSTFISHVGQMVENWLVNQVFMTAAQRVQLALQVTQHTTAEAAKTAATGVGVAARVGAEQVGHATLLGFDLLGVARHLAAETAKTAATFAGVAARIGAEISGFFGRLIALLAQALGIHVATEVAKTGATIAGVAARRAAETAGSIAAKTAALASAAPVIVANAAKAASGAYAALAGIPIIGPVLGAAAAVATFAAVMAYQTIASAEGGWSNVPQDQMALIHKEEMVLPRTIATPLRDALSGGLSLGPTNRGSGAAITAGNTIRNEVANSNQSQSLTYSPTINGADTGDLRSTLENHSRELVRLMRNHARNNVRIGSRHG